MPDDDRSPLDDLAAMFPGLDPDAASRMIAEVQRLGLDTARVVIDRFSALARQGPPGGASGFGAGAGSDGPTGDGFRAASSGSAGTADGRAAGGEGRSDASTRQLRADAERAVDAYLNVVRRLYDVVADLAGAAPGSSRSGPPAEPLRLPPAPPGGTSSAYAWLHNTTAAPAGHLVPRGAFLVDHRGHQIPGEALAFDPPAVARLEPGASQQLLATLRVPADAVPGTYHGVVLVEHLPDLALPVVAQVRPAAAHAAGAHAADG